MLARGTAVLLGRGAIATLLVRGLAIPSLLEVLLILRVGRVLPISALLRRLLPVPGLLGWLPVSALALLEVLLLLPIRRVLAVPTLLLLYWRGLAVPALRLLAIWRLRLRCRAVA